MRRLQFEQGSEEWHKWRKSLLTATDAAVLLGLSPYATPFKGWQRKTGRIPQQAMNSAMQRGHDDEPRARAMFIEESKINMVPCCIESDTYNFLGASLDGISDCGRYLLEVKSQDIERIKTLGIPGDHMCQMQHQLLSTDLTADMCFYVSIWGNHIYVLEVYPDLEWQKKYIPAAREYWRCIAYDEAPPLMPKDYVDRNNDLTWRQSADSYKELDMAIKLLEIKKEGVRKQLIELCADQSCQGSGIKIMKTTVKGRIPYDEVPEIKAMDLEGYRKPSSSSWKIMLDK